MIKRVLYIVVSVIAVMLPLCVSYKYINRNDVPLIQMGILDVDASIVDICKNNILFIDGDDLLCENIYSKTRVFIEKYSAGKHLYAMNDNYIISLLLSKGVLKVTQYSVEGDKRKETNIPYKYWNILSPVCTRQYIAMADGDGKVLIISTNTLSSRTVSLCPIETNRGTYMQYEGVNDKIYACISQIVPDGNEMNIQYMVVIENAVREPDCMLAQEVYECTDEIWQNTSIMHVVDNDKYYIEECVDGTKYYIVYVGKMRQYRSVFKPIGFRHKEKIFIAYQGTCLVAVDVNGTQSNIYECDQKIENAMMVSEDHILCITNTNVYMCDAKGGLLEKCRNDNGVLNYKKGTWGYYTGNKYITFGKQ